MDKYIHFSLYDEESADKVLSALSSKVRRDILRLTENCSYSIAEIAKQLSLPMSTAAFHIKHLSEANLIHIQVKSSQRGSVKVVSRRVNEICIKCTIPFNRPDVISTDLVIPIGSFTDCKVSPSCGLAMETHVIQQDDTPGVFFLPEKAGAQMLWFAAGYVEYKIPNFYFANAKPLGISFSMELCSEAPNYRLDWESDITFWVNGTEICTWTCPGDFGGTRGRLNPAWWSDMSSQYGLLKTVRVNEYGSYLDEKEASKVVLSDLRVDDGDYFTLRVGNKPDAAHVGGLNLFGEKFGNYEQNIKVRLEYEPN